MKTTDIMARLQAKYPTEKEYLQAVQEVLESIEEVYNQHPEFEKARIVERLVEPDRIFSFRVTWIDDKGEVQTNTGYRIQFNSAIGPYKGGLRFHKAVTPSIARSTFFLAALIVKPESEESFFITNGLNNSNAISLGKPH